MSSSVERDKINHQLTNEIFDRLIKFSNEPDRRLFCQRLQTIWQEQGIFCQSYPTITNQILDLYKLHHLVQEKQGYLEITTNRGWKEISNVLGFGDSGSAAYSVKRNYVRLGLLAYECRFDRAGLDPRSVIELSEMPHAVKKRKRGNYTLTTTRLHTTPKVNKQQHTQAFSNQNEVNDTKKSIASSTDVYDIPKSSIRYENFFSSYRLTPQQLPIHDIQQFSYTLRADCLADSNKNLDTLLVWLSDPQTASYFNLKSLPGLFNAIMEQYIACLYELYGNSFLQSSSINDSYVNWFLQSKFQINDNAIGPNSNQKRLESLFFGTRRYILKQLLNKSIKPKLNNSEEEKEHLSIENLSQDELENDETHTDRFHSIMKRCSCLTTIIRNLSFIEENEYLANDRRLLDILERILNCCHQDIHELFDYELSSTELYSHACSSCDTQLELSIDSAMQTQFTHSSDDFVKKFTKTSSDIEINYSFSCINDCCQRHIMYLLDNTFITLSNLSTFIEFHRCYSITRYRFINTLIHWILCSLSLANEPFISMEIEDKVPINLTHNQKKKDPIHISPRQLSLQILAKLCTNEMNVDFILLDLSFEKLKSLSHALLCFMNTTNQDNIDREYCLIIICSLCKRNRPLVEFFCSHRISIELIFNYLELYEYNQQQYLIATLASCCAATSSGPLTTPINHSIDMMVDSCIQLLLLFAPITENNCLKLFEYKLLNMSSSIYFEQRILKAFADILYIMKF